MAAQILEFRPILAYLKNPYLKDVRYFFRFSSIDTITDLNNLDRILMNTQCEWVATFGKNIDGAIIPHDLIMTYDVITSSVVTKLEKDWKNSIKFNESTESRFELIDDFINYYGLSSHLIAAYHEE